MKLVLGSLALALSAALFQSGGDGGRAPTPPAQDSAAQPQLPAVGRPAPGFRLNDQVGNVVAVGGKSARWTVIAFFPKAETPGCTREVCSLRDASSALSGLGVDLYALSLDGVAEQAHFAEEHELDFPVLSDPDGSVARKYGVLPEGQSFTRRVTFVLDDQGVLRAVDEGVNVDTHGQDLVDLVKELRK